MLITQLKDKETLSKLLEGKKVFIIQCFGCREVNFPEADAKAFIKELEDADQLTGKLTTDYICEPKNIKFQLGFYNKQIFNADAVLVFSCGVGVQTVAEILDTKRVYAACDSVNLPGNQGLTPLTVDCGQCGECYLNMTGGICPITACSKGLVNGQCGGSKNGKCEVNPDMECGWERIYRRLEKLDKLDNLKCPVQLRDYSKFLETKEFKES